jgi:truncated hemoglobin YjbI
MRALEHTRLGIAIRDNDMMQEAIRLAADGELGNSDAIRLLQIPHSPEDVRRVLRKFEAQLSREAKSKLTLDALVPRPDTVDNQRYEPIFDKYIITGETYTTASGAVVPNELQYYNGEMVHLYGECANVPRVNDSLAGSGYRAMTMEHPDGRETAVAELWSTRFTDCSIRPYGAMFIVVVVVRNDTPAGQASIRADPNDASSALVMLDGSLDRATAVYENKARLFMVRLLDTTQIAIEVGRERMGTDKRPGIVEMTRDGRHLRLSIKDQNGRGVVSGNLELADDPTAYLPDIAKAAATAGIPFRVLPRGTECSYPAVARIGQGPVVSWQWRSDLAPRLQPVMPNAIVFDSSSEEGRILHTWRFRPKVLGYIPNVRGVVTGLAQDRSLRPCEKPDDPANTRRHLAVFPAAERERLSLAPDPGFCPDADRARLAGGGIAVTQRTRDGSVMSWGTADAPAPPSVADPGSPVAITVAVSPIRPGHVVTVDYRVNGGPLRQVTALAEPRAQGVDARLFRAILPGQTGGLVEFLPVLRLAGQPMSPRLEESAELLRYDVGRAEAPVGAVRSHTSGVAVPGGQPHWAWDATFLGSLTAVLRKELVGVTPDGLRIDWHVTEGSFVGPGLDLVVLPGAADWMRIRKDGVGIVNVQACFEARTGARIYGSYGGLFDLGPDGYARALRDEYDRLPPVVVTPTYATADPRLEWLNRAQCIGVGRVDMTALRVEFDVYVVRVGERAQEANLYKRLGGYDVIAAITDDFIASIMADKQLGRLFVSGYTEARVRAIRQHVVDQLCEVTGGPCFYMGRDMKTTHKGLGITESDWKIAIALLTAVLNKYQVAPREQSEFMQIIQDMKSMIIENPGKP